MVELNTLGSVIKSTYEAEPNTNAFTDPEKAKLAGLADVATSGAYADLTGKPTIPSGSYEDLTGRPTLSPVATSGAYSDLSGRPDVILRSERGAANGVAPLDAAGMVPMIHLNVSGLSFKGAWNPTTNTPTLVDGTGEWPEQIDHDNGDRTDNRWLNMIEGGQSANAKNMARKSNNTSGVTGISWDKRRKMWHARVKEKGVTTNLGHYHCIAHASMVRHQIAREMGFSERHGS